METTSDYEKHPAGEWWMNITLPRIMKREKAEMFHGPFFLVPWRKTRFKKIVTIHDLIGFKFPETYSFKFRHYIRYAIKASARAADRIIVPSAQTKKDLMEITGQARNKIHVLPYYALPFFKPFSDKEIQISRKSLSLPERFILCVGTLEPRKNQIALIKAFEILKKGSGLPHKLVLIGSVGYKGKEVLRAIENSDFKRDIIHFSNKHLRELTPFYNLAELFVFPSYYEGFGLPVLEAMACGAPVVCSDAASLPEVAGDAAVFVPPDSPEALAKALEELLKNTEKLGDLKKKSLERARFFSEEKMAKNLCLIYEHA